MTHYIDIELLPNSEIAPQHILNRLFAKIHLALAKKKCKNIGVSFPKFKENKQYLGETLRLHGTQEILQDFGLLQNLANLKDYVQTTDILAVPTEVQGYRQIKRVQVKTNADRLRRRHCQRHNISMEEAAKIIPDSIEKTLNLPYIILDSASTGQQFKLFIKHDDISQKAQTGEFNCYGLSHNANVPVF